MQAAEYIIVRSFLYEKLEYFVDIPHSSIACIIHYRTRYCQATNNNNSNNILFKFREHARFAEISATARVFVAFRGDCARVQRTLGLARPKTTHFHLPLAVRRQVSVVGGSNLSRNGLTRFLAGRQHLFASRENNNNNRHVVQRCNDILLLLLLGQSRLINNNIILLLYKIIRGME